MRTNIYKDKIIAVLEKHHLLALSEIHSYISESDYSTIFRNVEQLLKEGVVRKIVISDKQVGYELAHDKHDHFVCTSCNKVEKVHISTKSLGIAVEDVVVRGTCTKCA